MKYDENHFYFVYLCNRDEDKKHVNNLIVELSFEQKFKSDSRIDVLSSWTDQRFQFDSRIDVC
jgi:hypothetical protein